MTDFNMIGKFDVVQLLNGCEEQHITTFALVLPSGFDFEGLIGSLKGVDVIPENDYGWKIDLRGTEIVIIDKLPEQRVLNTILEDGMPCRRRIILIEGDYICRYIKAPFTIRQIPIYKIMQPKFQNANEYADTLPRYIRQDGNDWFGKLFMDIIKELVVKIITEYVM